MLGSKSLGERTGKPGRCAISSLPLGFTSQQQLPQLWHWRSGGKQSLWPKEKPQLRVHARSWRGGQLRPECQSLPHCSSIPWKSSGGCWSSRTSHPGGRSTAGMRGRQALCLLLSLEAAVRCVLARPWHAVCSRAPRASENRAHGQGQLSTSGSE